MSRFLAFLALREGVGFSGCHIRYRWPEEQHKRPVVWKSKVEVEEIQNPGTHSGSTSLRTLTGWSWRALPDWDRKYPKTGWNWKSFEIGVLKLQKFGNLDGWPYAEIVSHTLSTLKHGPIVEKSSHILHADIKRFGIWIELLRGSQVRKSHDWVKVRCQSGS